MKNLKIEINEKNVATIKICRHHYKDENGDEIIGKWYACNEGENELQVYTKYLNYEYLYTERTKAII